jgi:hypothetical protein
VKANWLDDLDLNGVVDSRDLALVRRLLGRRLT